MEAINNSLLKITHFASLSKWSASVSTFNKITVPYPLIVLSKVLKRNKERITIEDSKLYKRITVRLYGMGVIQRDEVLGKCIGTKKQFLAHSGQLIISRIDARNGAFGIVPDELEGAIVTNDFWLFNVSRALPEYLMLVLSSPLFQQYWQTKSSGTTNRQRVDEQSFLSSKIALPSIQYQMEIIKNYNDICKRAEVIEHNISVLMQRKDDYLLESLGIRFKKCNISSGLLKTARFKNISQWGYNKIALMFPYEFTKYKAFSFSKKPHWVVTLFRGKSPKYSNESKDIILNQKCNRWDMINTSFAKTVESDWLKSVESEYFTREHDVLINSTGEGTLGRASLIREPKHIGLLFDSHMLLLRLNIKEVNPQIIVDLINSSFGQTQVEILKSAQATKQTELGKENLIKMLFPLPDLNTQNSIVKSLQIIKEKIQDQSKQAESLRKKAKKEFMEAVFGVQDKI